MKKLTILFLVIICVYACTQAVKKDDGFKIYNSFCANKDTNLCPMLPYDIDESFGFGYQSVLDSIFQPPLDAFSWQTFIALNWPADSSGAPWGDSVGSNPGAKRVWEYYSDPETVFTGGSPHQLLMQGRAEAERNGELFLYRDSKAPQDLVALSQNPNEFVEADGKPLIDRNINFTLYDIRINRVEAGFISNNQLTTVANIHKFAGAALDMPQSDSATQNDGIIEVKTSWRILDTSKGDDPRKFYCRNAYIYVDPGHTTNHQPLIAKAKVGLVGMHIIRKTPKLSGFLIWSTFEHMDNAPTDAEKSQQRQWSYYNAACTNCKINTPPPFQPGDSQQYLWNPAPPYAGHYADSMNGYGNQVIRVDPIYKYTEQMNGMWKAKLANTVWANYKLVGTQWERGEGLSSTKPAPVFLANTTLETYIQGKSSCIGCHGGGAYVTYDSSGTKMKTTTDFSFLYPIYAK